MEKKTYLILHATESPISGATHPLQKINYAVGLIEKDKFQSFIEEYKKTLKEYITNNIQKCSVDSKTEFSGYSPGNLEGEIDFIINFEDGNSHILNVEISEFEPNVFKHNKISHNL